jgi:hypothetical protein
LANTLLFSESKLNVNQFPFYFFFSGVTYGRVAILNASSSENTSEEDVGTLATTVATTVATIVNQTITSLLGNDTVHHERNLIIIFSFLTTIIKVAYYFYWQKVLI